MGNRQQQATNIDGPPPVFDPVKKEARFLSRNGDMTIVKFDSNNAAKTSVVKKWMDTAPYGPVTGFSQALNYYVVSFLDTKMLPDGIESAYLLQDPVAIPKAGIYPVVQDHRDNPKLPISAGGSVYMKTDGNIVVSNRGSYYTSWLPTFVVIDGKEVKIGITTTNDQNFVLSIPVGQQPKSDGSSLSERIKCTGAVSTPGIVAVSQLDAAALLKTMGGDPKTATASVLSVSPGGTGGLHVVGTGVPLGDMMYFATQIDGSNPGYNPLVAFNGTNVFLAVDDKIMWTPASNGRFIVNSYESITLPSFVTSLYVTPEAFYYSYGNVVMRYTILTQQIEKIHQSFIDSRVIGVVPSQGSSIVTQVFIAECSVPGLDQTKYTIERFTVVKFESYPSDGQCFKSVSWPWCYTGGDVTSCVTATAQNYTDKKCCLADAGAACPPMWTAGPSDYCTDFCGGKRNKCMRNR